MAEKKTQSKGKILNYKGRPLVRSGPVLYLGSTADEYVAMLTILSTKEVDGMQVANKVSVQIISTDATLRPKERIIKKSEKDGLYSAITIASIWLERLLNAKEA